MSRSNTSPGAFSSSARSVILTIVIGSSLCMLAISSRFLVLLMFAVLPTRFAYLSVSSFCSKSLITCSSSVVISTGW